MSDQDNNQGTPHKDSNTNPFEERVRLIQQQARKEGFVSNGSSEKMFMDEAWGEDIDNIPLAYQVDSNTEK